MVRIYIGVIGSCMAMRLAPWSLRLYENEIMRLKKPMLDWHGPNWDTRNVITELIVMFVYTIAHGMEWNG